MTAAAADLVPQEIAHDRARQRQHDREPQTEMTGSSQSSRPEEQGFPRHGWHELFHDHTPEECRVSVLTYERVDAHRYLRDAPAVMTLPRVT